MTIYFAGLGGVSHGDKPIIIAEACENHLGDIEKAIEMIGEAKAAGCEVIKFQHHIRDKEMVKGLKMSNNFDEDLYDFLGRCSLNIDQHILLSKECDRVGINYLCTPFCKEAAEELIDNNLCETMKIGSGEMQDFRLLNYLSEKKINLILSTGMSTINEIEETYEFLKSRNASFSLMHCVSEYPPIYDDVKLDTISFLRKKFPDTCIGFSCHTPSIYSAISAATLGVEFIEKHVTLDPNLNCPDKDVSLTFDQIKNLSEAVLCVYKSRGIRNEVLEKEKEIRSWARRIIVAAKEIKKGEVFTEDNLTTLRAGEGLSSKYFFKVINKHSKANIAVGSKLRESFF